MRFTLGKQLGLGFACVLALTILSAVLPNVKAGAIKEAQDRAMAVRVPTIRARTELQRDLNQTQNDGRQAILAGNQSTRSDSAKKSFDRDWEEIAKDVARLDELSPQWTSQANRDRLTETKQELPSLREFQEAGMRRAKGKGRDIVTAGNEFTDTAAPVTEAKKKSLGDIEDSFDKLLQQSREDMRAENRSLNQTTAIVTLIALANGIFVAVFLSRRVSGATQAVLRQAEAIAAGDLTNDDLKVRSRDELGDLTTAINTLSGSLKRMIHAITQNAVQVASASEELNTTSQQITANSEETSAQADVVSNAAHAVSQNLQTVATGAEEMGQSIKEIATTASDTAKSSTSAGRVAETTTPTVSNLRECST